MSLYQRPTLRDVARMAGVSHITVSRVVRGSPLVSAATALKVRWAVKRLGYRPDPTLSALAAYRSVKITGEAAGEDERTASEITDAGPPVDSEKDGAKDKPDKPKVDSKVNGEGDGKSKTPRARTSTRGSTVAFLDCDLHRTSREFNRNILLGVRREAGLFGYSVESFRLDPAEAMQKRLSRTLFHRGVRGLLFSPADSLWTFAGWDWAEFAPVSLGALEHEPAMHAVAMDCFQGAVQGYEKLERQGCRRIALVVNAKQEARTGHRWLGGFLSQGGTRSRYFGEGGLEDPTRVRAWAQRERIDGVLTIEPASCAALPGMPSIFLNNTSAPAGYLRPVLDPEMVGAEGVRLLHHMLLRHELGIPTERKRIDLQGRWTTERKLPAPPRPEGP